MHPKPSADRAMSPRDDYVLDPTHWPDMPSAHRAFLEAAIPRLRDERLVGLAAGGSVISRTLDEHSDLDLVVVSRPEVSGEVLRDGPDIARRLGPLLATFPGDRVGEPRLFISLYGPGRTAEWCPPRRAGCAGARGRLALDPGFARPAILLEGIDSDADALQRAPRAARSADAPTQSRGRTRRQGLPRGR